MNREIRIASGDLTAYQLLTTDSSIVVDWPIQTGQTSKTAWQASQPEEGEMRRQFRPSLGRGTGKWVGLWSGIIEFWAFNGAMREYFNETIMLGNPIAIVTAYLHSIEHNEYQVFVGELVTPHAIGSDSDYSRFEDDLYYGNRYIFRRARLKTLLVLATAADEALLTHNNKMILVDQQT